MFVRIGGKRKQSPRLPALVTLFAITLAALLWPGVSSADDCSGLAACQATDQARLLGPFNALLGSPAGAAVLATNLQTQNAIYLNSTQAQKVASGTVLIVQYIAANILLRAFPDNPNFGYTQGGLPNAPSTPGSIAAAVSDIYGNTQLNAMKPFFGSINVYQYAYGLLPGQIDSVGNPPPYQVSAAIHDNPFIAANSSPLAAQNQQTQGAFGINWQDQGDSMTGDFPSAHTMIGNIHALTYAVLAPGYYQQLAQAAADFAYDLNVFGVHYPTDVIGGRILATYVVAETLAGNALYPSSTSIPGNIASLSQAMQGFLGGGGSSPYAAPCAGNVAACVAGGAIPNAATYAQMAQRYAALLTYGLPSVSDTTLAPVVPTDAHFLIATRFPYLNTAQLNQILATTELPSGGPIDNGTGWARLNLYAAAGGYGAFPTNVTVSMNAALGGLNAFDVWSNAITGPGGLTLQGSGTLVLAGNNSYTGDTVVQGGTLAVTGSVAGNVAVWSGASFAGNGTVGGSLALLAGSTYQAGVAPNDANLLLVGGTATLSGATLAIGSVGGGPPLGTVWPILGATGGINGRFSAVTEPTSGLADGTRIDTLYASNAISLVVTPRFYGNLAAAGLAQRSSEVSVGAVLDANRPVPGAILDPVQSALFDPLYTLSASNIAAGLDELAPSIYPDTMITARNSWYLMANAISGQLAARRGLAAEHAASSAPGPNGSTIWVSGLAGYDSVGAGGSPGFTAGLGGTAAGIDVPVLGNARIGVAVGTVEGQTWSQASGNASSSTAQLVGYGQWQGGMVFADLQLGLMYQQENVRRDLALFGTGARGSTDGLAGGGGVRVGVQQEFGGWLIEPSLGFGGFDLHLGNVAESGGVLAENIGGATLGSAETTLAVSAQRGFALNERVRMIVTGRLGWSHEFADNTANVTASFQGLNGSGFALSSAPIGRDAALVGLGADIKVASWPVAMFVDYGGAISGSSSAQSFSAGLRLTW
jgi:autotransporter-associated beta strand protein